VLRDKSDLFAITYDKQAHPFFVYRGDVAWVFIFIKICVFLPNRIVENQLEVQCDLSSTILDTFFSTPDN